MCAFARTLVLLAVILVSYHSYVAGFDGEIKEEVSKLVEDHFSKAKTKEQHPNAVPVEKILGSLKGKPLHAIETGTSAWGLDSTRLFDDYIRKYGGFVNSVDIRPKAGELLLAKGPLSNGTHLHVGDSVKWLKEGMFQAIRDSVLPMPVSGGNGHAAAEAAAIVMTHADANRLVDLWFLDSWDVNWDSPDICAFHGFSEVMAVLNPNIVVDQEIALDAALAQSLALLKDKDITLKPGSYIWIDDTPKDVQTWQKVHGSAWRSQYNEDPSNIMKSDKFKTHMQLSKGVFPGKGSFAFMIFRAFPLRFKMVYHEYSVVFKVL
jgi:hypothetical protein